MLGSLGMSFGYLINAVLKMFCLFVFHKGIPHISSCASQSQVKQCQTQCHLIQKGLLQPVVLTQGLFVEMKFPREYQLSFLYI